MLKIYHQALAKNSESNKRFGKRIEQKLTLTNHLSDWHLIRMFAYISLHKRKSLTRSFFSSQIEYCHIAWVDYSGTFFQIDFKIELTNCMKDCLN